MKVAYILAALLLSACARDYSVPTASAGPQDPGPSMNVVIDEVTGCQYLQNAGLTRRIAADGKTHMGCRGARPNVEANRMP